MNETRTQDARTRGSLAGPILTYGFGTAILVWTVWYLTHLPWAGVSEQASIPVILLAWLIVMIGAGQAGGWRVGLGAGFVTALIGLLLLGSTLTEHAPAGEASLKPNALLIVAGFLALGAGIGLLGGAVGRVLRRGPREHADWLSRFALVAAISVAPLLFIGGMVTSTNSGMAVPDWPNTFGSNMFLYPLGPRAQPSVFFEHSHRLFGSLVGLTSLVLMVWVLATAQPRWLKILAVITFAMVVVQGVVGGGRVLFGDPDAVRDNRFFALVHGVLAQLTFGLMVSLAVFLSPTFKAAGAIIMPGTEVPGGRRLRFFTTGLLHSTILQLLLGAAYRHFRDNHSLWSHAGFSAVVLVFAILAGFAAGSLAGPPGPITRTIRTFGTALIVVVSLQFALGWATFAMGGRTLEAGSPSQALLRTAHQANGGLLLGVAAAAFLWTRRLLRLAGVTRRAA
jgi:cytochrome c oxidase assembly protein subunit 15